MVECSITKNKTRQLFQLLQLERFFLINYQNILWKFNCHFQELVDEHAQGILSRISSRLMTAVELLRDHITRQDLLAVASVIGTVLFIVAIGYVMTYLV